MRRKRPQQAAKKADGHSLWTNQLVLTRVSYKVQSVVHTGASCLGL